MQKGNFVEAGAKLENVGDYQPLFSWKYLEWQFDDEEEKKAFYDNKYYAGAMPAGIGVDSAGNYYMSVPRWHPGIPATFNRIEMVDGKPLLVPYPNKELNEEGNPEAMQSILGFEIDENDVAWILDQGHVCDAESVDGSQKIVIYDLRNNKLIDSIKIPDEISSYKASFLNDICVDNENGYAYIADSGIYTHPLQGGIIVYNMKDHSLRRVLHQDKSTQDFPGFTFAINGSVIYEGDPMRTGVDGITLSHDRKTLYYSPLTGHELFSIPTELLWDTSLSDEELSRAVKDCGSKHTNTDGMIADNQGRIWYTMLEHMGMGYYDPADGSMNEFVQDERMIWVDSPAFDNQGNLIFTTNQLHFLNTGRLDFDKVNLYVWRARVGEGVKAYLM